MIYEKGTCLLSVGDDDAGIEFAREYIKKNGFTSDQVRMGRKDGFIYVIAKQEVQI